MSWLNLGHRKFENPPKTSWNQQIIQRFPMFPHGFSHCVHRFSLFRHVPTQMHLELKLGVDTQPRRGGAQRLQSQLHFLFLSEPLALGRPLWVPQRIGYHRSQAPGKWRPMSSDKLNIIGVLPLRPWAGSRASRHSPAGQLHESPVRESLCDVKSSSSAESELSQETYRNYYELPWFLLKYIIKLT